VDASRSAGIGRTPTFIRGSVENSRGSAGWTLASTSSA
jgi:hypothetical protein